jgi:hypothetical protein
MSDQNSAHLSHPPPRVEQSHLYLLRVISALDSLEIDPSAILGHATVMANWVQHNLLSEL